MSLICRGHVECDHRLGSGHQCHLELLHRSVLHDFRWIGQCRIHGRHSTVRHIHRIGTSQSSAVYPHVFDRFEKYFLYKTLCIRVRVRRDSMDFSVYKFLVNLLVNFDKLLTFKCSLKGRLTHTGAVPVPSSSRDSIATGLKIFFYGHLMGGLTLVQPGMSFQFLFPDVRTFRQDNFNILSGPFKKEKNLFTYIIYII